jgi:Bifunctional DNA primase/polymerase, N-terminal/AAA domain/Primase C terminal 1 (PriCT-1)
MLTNPTLEAALGYAGRGWEIVPLFEPRGEGCSCSRGKDCPSPGKHPRTPHGIKDASRDEITIRTWFERSPSANVAIATGNGLAVLDVDPRSGGDEKLRDLCAKHGAIADAPRVETGGGGFHLYFTAPSTCRPRNIGNGVELKGRGLSVVAPPSLHASGKRYEWTVSPDCIALPEIPAWLTEIAIETRNPLFTGAEGIVEGDRHNKLVRFGFGVRCKGGSLAEVYAALSAINSLSCNPPLPEKEIIGIAASIDRTVTKNSEHSVVSAHSHSPSGGVGAETKSLKFISGKDFPNLLPNSVEWIAKPWVAAGAITVLTGKVKTAGKTTLITHLLHSVIEGKSFLGEKTRKSNVVFLSEQPFASLRESLSRAHLLNREEIAILPFSGTFGWDWNGVANAAIAECLRTSACLLVIDTLGQFAGIQGDRENSAGTALDIMLPLQRAASTGIGVLLSRHERKTGGDLGDSGRGSSAYEGAVDTVLSLRRPAGRTRSTLRVIRAISRFDEVPEELTIELTADSYSKLGTSSNIVECEVRDRIVTSLDTQFLEGAALADLVGLGIGSRASIQRALGELVQAGKVQRRGDGKRGRPLLFTLK